MSAGPADSADAVLRLGMLRDHHGWLKRVYAPAKYHGADVWLEVDTGSQRSLLHHEISDASPLGALQTVEVGKETIRLHPRLHSFEPSFQGREVIGTLGTDYFAGRIVEIDLTAGILVLDPHDTAELPALSFDLVEGIALSRIEVDGRVLRLMVDTGTDDLMLIDHEVDLTSGRTYQTHDINGAPMNIVSARANIRLPGDASREVPLWRAQTHPALEAHVRELGGDVAGILGLTALGSRKVIFDFPRKEIRLGPLVRGGAASAW